MKAHLFVYAHVVDCVWDPKKAARNRRDHKIDFADAVMVFEDEWALTMEDDDPSELRYVTIGMDALARLLVVVWTWRGESIRLISARKATRYERRQYKEGL